MMGLLFITRNRRNANLVSKNDVFVYLGLGIVSSGCNLNFAEVSFLVWDILNSSSEEPQKM